jgi:hypothetical protein
LDNEVRIFYSWQSDLPSNGNRNLIGDAIDKAVKYLKNAVEIVADRDTQNMIGSPNIEETIFEKIDNCDLFIADVSIVGSYEDTNGRLKHTPNANVLIELGYAVRVLGWDRVICIINADHGGAERLPFDLCHHRVLSYSIEKSSKNDIRNEIRDVISSTVMTMMENGLRAKAGFASYVVGCYDASIMKVVKQLIPTEIREGEYSRSHIIELKKEIRGFVEKIQGMVLTQAVKDSSVNGDTLEGVTISSNEKKNALSFDLFSFSKVKIKDDDARDIREYTKKFFDIDLNDDFFYLGDLEESISKMPMIGNQYRGSDEAKEKYDLINQILYNIGRIWLFESYLKTFDDMVFFNLAIWNTSPITDKDVSVDVVVNLETAEVVIPDESLIEKSIAEIAGMVYEEKIVEPLFGLRNSTDICDGSDYGQQSFPTLIKQANIGMMVDPFGYGRSPQYDIDDYVSEIQKYIASPFGIHNNEFSFHVSTIRPNEKNWIGKGLLIKPKVDEVVLSYKITSESTDGNVHGELRYIVTHSETREEG